MLLLCILICSIGLFLHALCEPKMRRFAKLSQTSSLRLISTGRIACLLLALVLPLCQRPATAVFLWAGAFSLSALIVSISWATLAWYRERHEYH